MNYEKAWLCVMAETDPEKRFATINSDHYGEMRFTNQEKAKSYPPSAAVRRVEIVFGGLDAGRVMPPVMLSLQAVFEDGSVVPGCPAPRYVAPRPKTPTIPTLPDVPPVVKLEDGTWRVTPRMEVKYSQGGTYYAIPYAFFHQRSPVSGYFKAPTQRDLFDLVFDTQSDAVADGHGGWLDPRNPQNIATPTLEQTFRSLLPIADAAEVQRWLDLVAQRDQAIAEAEREKYRMPTEQEIEAADASAETVAKMPADVFKAKYFSDPAFRIKNDRRELAEKKIAEKAQKEAAEEQRRKEVDWGRKLLEDREKGIVGER